MRRDWYCEDVLSGRTAVRTVFEDDRVLAFHHPDPAAEVHVVIIPRHHVASILDPKAREGALLTSMVQAVQEVARITGLRGPRLHGPDERGRSRSDSAHALARDGAGDSPPCRRV